MITVPHSPNFAKNQEKGVPPNQCFICGKEVKKPKHFIRVFDPDRIVTEAEAQTIADIERAEGGTSDMWYWHIGGDCFRQHPELKPYVADATKARADWLEKREAAHK